MIDIHHHLLPGLDDGSPDLETSLKMAAMAAADGITHVVCTPHANHRYPYDPFRVEDLIASLRLRLREAGIALELARGADFHLTFENIQAAIADPGRYSLAGRGYLMTELPDYATLSSFDETYYHLQLAGMTPVITHPERNPTLQERPGKLADWLRLGALVQVTAGSILGHMGKKAQKLSLQLLQNKWVHFVATDAHNLTSRPPKLQPAYIEVSKRFGIETADRLFVVNPLCAFEGRPLAAQPEPSGLYDDEPGTWWSRIFGKNL